MEFPTKPEVRWSPKHKAFVWWPDKEWNERIHKMLRVDVVMEGESIAIRDHLHVTILPMHQGQHLRSFEYTDANRALGLWLNEAVQPPIVSLVDVKQAIHIVKPVGFDVTTGYSESRVGVDHPDWNPHIPEESLIVRVSIENIEEINDEITRVVGSGIERRWTERGLALDPSCLHITVATWFGGGIPISTGSMLQALNKGHIDLSIK